MHSRSAGGSDEANLVPLERIHHVECETLGRKTFERKYGLNLELAAEVYWQLWRSCDVHGLDPHTGEVRVAVGAGRDG